MTAPRYACLLAKEFPLQALLRLRPELQRKPVVVLDGEPPFEQVCSLNRLAILHAGVSRIEIRHVIVLIAEHRMIFPAEAVIDGQVSGHFPIVLSEYSKVFREGVNVGC